MADEAQEESRDLEAAEEDLTSLTLETDAVLAQWRMDADTAVAAAKRAAVLGRVRLLVRDLLCLMLGSYGPILLIYLSLARIMPVQGNSEGNAVLHLFGFLGNCFGSAVAYLTVCFWGRQPFAEREPRLFRDTLCMAVVDVIAIHLVPDSLLSTSLVGRPVADLMVLLCGSLMVEGLRCLLTYNVSVQFAPPVPTAFIPRPPRPE